MFCCAILGKPLFVTMFQAARKALGTSTGESPGKKKLKMGGTFYDSPHGLSNKLNYSCAEDQAFLVTECMKIDIFRKVVGQK